MPSLSIIIPVRAGGDPYITLRSLARSTFQDFEIIISQDEWGNANKARNAGYALACKESKFVLFSDDDIEWEPRGIADLFRPLLDNPIDRSYGVVDAYSYGTYEMGGKLYCQTPFTFEELRCRNLASTMSIIRRGFFPGWDESLERLQDYGLWLQIAFSGQVGVYCGSLIFRTGVRDGITRNGGVTYEDAYSIVKQKNARLPMPEMAEGIYGSKP